MAQKSMVEVAGKYDGSFLEGDSAAAKKELERRNVERMGALVEALGRDDFEKVRTLVHDDVTLAIVAPEEVRFIREAEGVEAFVDVCRRNYAMLGEMNPVVQSVVAQGEVVLCILRDRGSYAADGAPYATYAAQELTFRDGKLARVWEMILPEP